MTTGTIQPLATEPPVPGSSYCPHLFYAGVGLAGAALLLLGAAGMGTRLGLWHFRTGFTLFTYAGYGGLAASALTLLGFMQAIKGGNLRRGLITAVATAVAMATFFVPLNYRRIGAQLPRIHDLTTDPDHPPQFVAILPLRQDAPNSVEYGGEEVAAKQRQAYPDLKPLVIDLPPEPTFAKALTAALAMHWKIVATDPTAGRIEATATTFWFGFKDDIAIRLTPVGKHTQVDVRSLSRVGIGDFGTNAERIKAYLALLSSP